MAAVPGCDLLFVRNLGRLREFPTFPMPYMHSVRNLMARRRFHAYPRSAPEPIRSQAVPLT